MSGRLRLLSVIHGPAFGGAHQQALRLAPLLADRGIETIVVLPEEAGAAARRLRDGGVATETIPLSRLRATASPAVQLRFGRSLPGDVARLRDLIRDRDIDVVQAHGVTNGQGALAARREGAAVVWQLFDTRAPVALRRLGMPVAVRLADVITTWGDELARVHPGADSLGEGSITVYPPVDGASFAPDAAARTIARDELGVDDDEVLVGAVGVLNPQKGHEHLIRAAERVIARRPETRFVILGGASPAHAGYERQLRSERSARGLDGKLEIVDPGPRVPELLQGLDIFAMTSVPRSEGMPTVILEAMNCGKPVVTTRVGAVAELVEDGRSALVVPPCRPDLIGDAILRVMDDEALARTLREGALERARTRFDLEQLADLHANAYRLAVRRRASTAS